MGTIFLQANPADALTFDNVDFEQVSPTARVTLHPIETGAIVGDHVQQQSTPISVRGRLSDTPFGPARPSGSDLAFAFFRRAQGQVVTYVSLRDGAFSDLFVTASGHRNEGRRETVFNVSFQQVPFAEAVSVPIPPRQPRPDGQVGLASPQDAGQQPPQPADPATLQSGALTFGSLLFQG